MCDYISGFEVYLSHLRNPTTFFAFSIVKLIFIEGKTTAVFTSIGQNLFFFNFARAYLLTVNILIGLLIQIFYSRASLLLEPEPIKTQERKKFFTYFLDLMTMKKELLKVFVA